MPSICQRPVPRSSAAFACLLLLAAGVAAQPPESPLPTPAVTCAQLEADWLVQARLRTAPLGGAGSRVAPVDDAAGGCDGVINGKWGFHTELEADPWWQVDLGAVSELGTLRIYNRCDGFEARAAHLRVLLSSDGDTFQLAYTHDGSVFRGHPDQQPLVISLPGQTARFVRLQLPGQVYFHLDEVEIFAAGGAANVALNRPATQSSVSPWSVKHARSAQDLDWAEVVNVSLTRGLKLAAALGALGVDTRQAVNSLQAYQQEAAQLDDEAAEPTWRPLYFAIRQTVRELALANPLLDFEDILFVKRAPTMFPHLSDQYYGWWARPGGGLCVLENFKSPDARIRQLTPSWPAGNFVSPDLSFDATRVAFAFSRFEPRIADEPNKRDKANVPEHVFYHLFEMDLETGSWRQLTRGKYDDIDARYLPTGDVLFLSTRKGQFLQTHPTNTQQTVAGDLPDSYVRCGGGDARPVPVFTLHAVSADGARIWPVSSFETFEYTPSIAHDGRILYCRWDYIDRFNGHFFSLWSTNPDATNAQLVYGNHTVRPQATLEPRSIPGSNKIIFTAAAHHSITGGSLVLLDQARGNEGEVPLTRLTPEVPFPETEENVDAYYANPWPLSEDFYLVSWSNRRLPPHGRYEDDSNPVNAQGIYLFDRFGNLELLHRDPDISSMTPIPIRPREAPKAVAELAVTDAPQAGQLLLQNIYDGMPGVEPGTVARLRIVGVVPKVQPYMNDPSLGVSQEETGKFVLGTVPVEADGSAYFSLPSGLPVFFQALDADGLALQTMRSLTYVQPGQTLSCIGCHESRFATPSSRSMLALLRGPSRIEPDVEGTWPLRFDTLVQPVLDQKCRSCHQPGAESTQAAQFDLSPERAWKTLIEYADRDLHKLVYERDASVVGDNPARQSKLLQYLASDAAHRDVALTDADVRRLAAWMDTYGHTQGAFSREQETQLEALRHDLRQLLD
ncbi:MAG: discoidin domain-containing protein [Pirellulaceae bacterium]|nr:discoidin domain-containing protein [Pirellulaceae bacterium]